MSIRTSFFDGQEYGAEDLNRVFNYLVTGGIEDPFTDDVPNNLSALNELVEGAAVGGVVRNNDALAVAKIGSSYYIKTGVAFFGSGATMEIYGANEPITVPQGTDCIVYLCSSAQENRCYIAVDEGTSFPENSDIVPLAKISATGTITDERRYATGKVDEYGYVNNVRTLKTTIISDSVSWASGGRRTSSFTHDLGTPDIKMLVLLQMQEACADDNYYPTDRGEGTHGAGRRSKLAVYLMPDGGKCIRFFVHTENSGSSGSTDMQTGDSITFEVDAENDNMSNRQSSSELKIEHSAGNMWAFSYTSPYLSSAMTGDFMYRIFYI